MRGIGLAFRCLVAGCLLACVANIPNARAEGPVSVSLKIESKDIRWAFERLYDRVRGLFGSDRNELLQHIAQLSASKKRFVVVVETVLNKTSGIPLSSEDEQKISEAVRDVQDKLARLKNAASEIFSEVMSGNYGTYAELLATIDVRKLAFDRGHNFGTIEPNEYRQLIRIARDEARALDCIGERLGGNLDPKACSSSLDAKRVRELLDGYARSHAKKPIKVGAGMPCLGSYAAATNNCTGGDVCYGGFRYRSVEISLCLAPHLNCAKPGQRGLLFGSQGTTDPASSFVIEGKRWVCRPGVGLIEESTAKNDGNAYGLEALLEDFLTRHGQE